MEYKAERLHFIDSENICLIYDIDTNTVAQAEDDKSKAALCHALEKKNYGLNFDVLRNSDYADGSNLAININLTPACNLACVYCFAQGGNYGNQREIMNADIIEELSAIIKNNVTSSKIVRFEYFGGEPLMNFEVIKEIVEFSKKLTENDGINFIHRISTNLTILTDEMIKVIGDNNFIVSISIDGGKEIQDAQRPFKNKKGSYEIIIENVKKLRKAYPRLLLVARITISQKEKALYTNLLDLIATNYFDYASIYPASVKDEKNNTYQYYFDEEIKKQYLFVITHYKELFASSARFKGILEFEKIYDQIVIGRVSISHCAAGGTYFTISSDKSVVPCHRLCGKKEYYVINTDIKLNCNFIKGWYGTVDEHAVCSKCWVRYICGGGCKQEHLAANGNITIVNPYSCEYQKFIIENIIKSFTNLPKEFLYRERNIDDMFVFCGRPLINNQRDLNVFDCQDMRKHIFSNQY